MVCQFLLFSKVTQPYVYAYMCIYIYIYICVCVCVCVYIHSFSHIIFHTVLSQEIGYSSLCYTVGPH